MEDSEKTTSNVLVTGADNGAGRAIAKKLAASGYTVTGTVTTAEQAIAMRQDGVLPAYPGLLRAGEIRSVIKAAGADVVVHAATQAYNQVPQLKTDWDAALKLVEQGTSALITAAQDAGVKLIVYISYAFAGDVAPAHGHGHDEDHGEAEDPAIVTAIRAAEQAVLASSVPAVILRAGYTYGPYSSETLALRDALIKNRPLALGDPHAAANWIQVDDLASAVLQAIDRRPEGQIIDVVDGQSISPAAFAGYLAESMNLPAPTGQQSFINRVRFGQAQLDLLDRSVQADNAKAKDVLGWTPQYASARAGLDQVLLVLRAEEPVR
jgi:nucleoside-diphosphate-sugar epimerase